MEEYGIDLGKLPAAKSLREPDPAPFCGKVGGAPVARFN
jgi:hypothetical protein